MNVSLSQSTSRREFYIFFYKYRLRLFMSFLLPFAIAVGISFIPTPRYKAESVLIVRLGSEFVYQPEVGSAQNGGDPTIPFDRDQIFKSEVAILSSADLHRQVINAIGIDILFPDLAHPQGFALVMATAHNLINGKLQEMGLLHVQEEQLTPEQIEQRRLARAEALFDKHLDILLEKESAVINVSFEHKDPTMAVKVLDTLLSLYYEKRKQVFLEPRAELAETQRQATHQHALAAQWAVEDFKRKHKIYSLEEQRKQLLDARNEAQKQALSFSSPDLDEKIASYTRQLDQLDAQEREFSVLQHEADIANESYGLYSHRLDEAKAYEDLQRERIGSVRVIQPPLSTPEPKRLQPLIIMAGTFVSLVIMLLVAAITEYSRRGFMAPEQIERSVALPVLAVIPYRKRP